MGMYSTQFNGVAVTAQQDFFELVNAATKVVVVHEVRLAQSTDVGDAAEEGLSLLVKRGVGSTSGSGGSAGTVVKFQTGDAAGSASTEVNNTTKMSAGTITTLLADVWNVRAGWLWLPTPECRPVLAPSERLTVELGTTPADSITVNGTIIWEEIG